MPPREAGSEHAAVAQKSPVPLLQFAALPDVLHGQVDVLGCPVDPVENLAPLAEIVM